MDKCQRLVFSFYREELVCQLLLGILSSTKFNMIHGKVYIHCLNIQSFKEAQELIIIIARPFYLLGIGKEIILQAPNGLKKVYDIREIFSRDILA